MTSPDPTAGTAEQWRVRLICCGRDDGEYIADTWEAANEFREAYTSGYAVAEHGYSASPGEWGHRRAGIVEKLHVPGSDPTAGTVLGEEACICGPEDDWFAECPTHGEGDARLVTAEILDRAWIALPDRSEASPADLRAALAAVLPDLLSAAREAGREEGREQAERLTREMDDLRALLRAGTPIPAEFLYPDEEALPADA